MSKYVNKEHVIFPGTTVEQLIGLLLKEFETTGTNRAEFDIPGTVEKRRFVLEFDVRMRPIDKSTERNH